MTYTLICDASLTTDIDTSVNINIIWERNGTVINDTQRTSLSDNIPLSDFVYRSILSFATLSRAVDSGRYSCVVSVIAAELVEYIGNVSVATSHTISVEGECMSSIPYCNLRPVAYIVLQLRPHP